MTSSGCVLPGPLVTPAWLAENLSHENLVVLDASMKPVGLASAVATGDGDKQIPGTRIFDFDTRICDPNTSLPHMMPSQEHFEKEVRALGVQPDSCIVIYDRVGVYSSPRARWMFKAMGYDQVAVLDGGWPAWVAEGHLTERSQALPISSGLFSAKSSAGVFCDIADVTEALTDSSVVILDARSKGRFGGTEPEPRPGLKAGHMPNALNLPFGDVLMNGRMRSVDDLKNIFSVLIRPDQKIIATCGSGVTACIIAFAAELAGYSDVSVYDGSWSEWGASPRPVTV